MKRDLTNLLESDLARLLEDSDRLQRMAAEARREWEVLRANVARVIEASRCLARNVASTLRKSP